MTAVITAAAGAGAGTDAIGLADKARTIKNEGWRAIALIAIAVAGSGPIDFAEAYALISQVPHGDPRTQV